MYNDEYTYTIILKIKLIDLFQLVKEFTYYPKLMILFQDYPFKIICPNKITWT